MVLIDTSAWIEALRKKGDENVRADVDRFLRNGKARLTEPVLVELFHGANGSSELEFLKDLQGSIPILPCNSSCYEMAIQIAQLSRKKGITVSSMDLLIFSVAKFYKAEIISKDRHFSLLESLKLK
jgi:predicted nucleic acid-binding protein